MTTTAKALQKLSVKTMQGGQEIDEFTVEPGQSLLLLTGNGYRTEVEPSQLVADRLLADYGWGEGKALDAARRIEMYVDHMAAGGHINASPYGKLYE